MKKNKNTKVIPYFDPSFKLAYIQIPSISAITNTNQRKNIHDMLESITIMQDVHSEIYPWPMDQKSSLLTEIQLVDLIKKYNNILINKRHKYIGCFKLNSKDPYKSKTIAHGVKNRIGKTYEQLDKEFSNLAINYKKFVNNILMQYQTNNSEHFFIYYIHALTPNSKKYFKISLVKIIKTEKDTYVLFIGNSETSHTYSKKILNQNEKILENIINSNDCDNITEHINSYKKK